MNKEESGNKGAALKSGGSLDFGNEIFAKEKTPVALFGLATMLCCILVGNIHVRMLPAVIISGIGLFLMLPVPIFVVVNKQLCQSVTEDLFSFHSYETSVKERTKLIKQLMALPAKNGIAVFIIFMLCGVCWTAACVYFAGLDNDTVIVFLLTLFIGAYCAAVYAMTGIAQKQCSGHAAEIVEKGISKEDVSRRHYFGTTSTAITALHIFAPLLFVNVAFFILAWRTYVSDIPQRLVFLRLGAIGLIAVLFYYIYSSILFRRMMKSINNMKTLLSGMNKDNLHKVQFEHTDLSNEFMYNVYLINTIVGILQNILRESQRISMDVIESSNELSVISKETAVTSLEQTTGIRELLSAMEETDALSKNIAGKIGEVSIVARRTTENIAEGFDILRQNMQKQEEIQQANGVTVEGIKKLSEKITGISDIAGIINGIADQTNIIAFNAELEASSAGSAGGNFSLVANEIRRLTNRTIRSTDEIRRRIVEIQHSSDALLSLSQDGSKKIAAGNQIIQELNARFEELKRTSETTDYASEDIKKIIEQQTASFAQIVITLRQISEAAESFSGSTQKISDSAQNLCVISEKLKNIQPDDTEGSAAPAAEKAKASEVIK